MDVDSANFNGGSLTARITDGRAAGNQDIIYFLANTPGSDGLTGSGGRLFFDKVAFGTYTFAGPERVFTFNENATPERVQALLMVACPLKSGPP